MITLKRLLFPAAAVAIGLTAIPSWVHAQGDAWDTGPGTVATTIADVAQTPLVPRPNGSNTHVATTAADGTVVNLVEPTGGISDYIYAFHGEIWFLSDVDSQVISLPDQLIHPTIPLTTFRITEDGTFQPMVVTNPTTHVTTDIFGTTFRVQSDLDPIPEPAAWAMMILGAGLFGLALRWRRRFAVA